MYRTLPRPRLRLAGQLRLGQLSSPSAHSGSFHPPFFFFFFFSSLWPVSERGVDREYVHMSSHAQKDRDMQDSLLFCACTGQNPQHASLSGRSRPFPVAHYVPTGVARPDIVHTHMHILVVSRFPPLIRWTAWLRLSKWVLTSVPGKGKPLARLLFRL